MTTASAMKATDGFDKNPWRQSNYDWLRQQSPLWNGSLLRYPYVELLGETGDEMYRILKRHIPKGQDKQFFIGMDIDAGTIMRHALAGVPFGLMFADSYEAIPRLLREGRVFGAVGLDTTDGLRGDLGVGSRWWLDHSHSLQAIVDLATQRERCPRGFVLILNHTLDRGAGKGTTVRDRLEMHADGLVATFGKRWGLKKSTLMDGSEPLAAQKMTVGRAGGFEVYRSAPRRKCRRCSWVQGDEAAGDGVIESCPECSSMLPKRLRMLTVRLAFDGQREVCTVQRG